MADTAAGAASGAQGLLLLLLLLVAVVVGAAVAAWWLSSRSARRRGAPDNGQEEARANVDGQILSMLVQAGGTLDQIQIRENLGLSVGETAAALRRLEEEGRISRLWQAQGYTYTVRTTR
jgi:uncharacterized membrane protein